MITHTIIHDWCIDCVYISVYNITTHLACHRDNSLNQTDNDFQNESQTEA